MKKLTIEHRKSIITKWIQKKRNPKCAKNSTRQKTNLEKKRKLAYLNCKLKLYIADAQKLIFKKKAVCQTSWLQLMKCDTCWTMMLNLIKLQFTFIAEQANLKLILKKCNYFDWSSTSTNKT